jgi:methionyl aminopeptidase
MIPTSAELETLREVGQIASAARSWAAKTIKPGYLLRDLQEGMETMIREAGALPPFPAQTSRNDVAAHYCSSPSDNTRFEENDLVKIDVGAHIDGLIVDTGVSADLSGDQRWANLIGAASDALDAAINMCTPDLAVDDIGERVDEVIGAAGFKPVVNLTGHGLGRYTLHDRPQIPNARIGLEGSLEAGSIFAIEPFATSGKGYIKDKGKPEVFMLYRSPKSSNKIDADSLAAIEAWRGLPIARRYFNDLPKKPFERTLKELINQGAMREYEPLVEITGAHVGWKEHSIWLGPNGPETLTA